MNRKAVKTGLSMTDTLPSTLSEINRIACLTDFGEGDPSRTKTQRHKDTQTKQGWSFFPNGGKSHGLIAIPFPRLIERGNATVRDVRSAITTSPNLIFPSA